MQGNAALRAGRNRQPRHDDVGQGAARRLVGPCRSRRDRRHQPAARRARPGDDRLRRADLHRPRGDAGARSRPDLVIVCTPDDTHDDIVVRALEAGADVITEKPMTTTVGQDRRASSTPRRRTGRRVDVSFNYRFAPDRRAHQGAARCRRDRRGDLGRFPLVSRHRARRRLLPPLARLRAAFRQPVRAQGDPPFRPVELVSRRRARVGRGLRPTCAIYGRNGPFRGPRCQTCEHARRLRLLPRPRQPTRSSTRSTRTRPRSTAITATAACSARTSTSPTPWSPRSATRNGVHVSYSLNTFQPIEGHHIAFNGTRGRIELRQYEKQPWETPDHDEILLVRNFPGRAGGRAHRRAALPGRPLRRRRPDAQHDLPAPAPTDPLGQRAGSRAGAMSVLCGIAALPERPDRRRPVRLRDLMPELAARP